MVEFKLQYIKSVNFAVINNGIAICENATLRSVGSAAKEVVVECSGEYFVNTTSPVLPHVPQGQEVRLTAFAIKPSAKAMAALTEKLITTFTIVVWENANDPETKKEVFRHDYEIELMPYDQWLGTSIMPQSLASFVTPNHPVVSKVVVEAAKILKEQTGNSTLSEYQTGNPTDVIRQVAAVYGALHDKGIVYRALPASFEAVGQRVTLPEAVLTGKLGNCVELSILFASVLEAIGINTAIIMEQGHAYLGVWLVDDCCQYSVCDDVAFVEKKCSKGINEMLVLEATMLTNENTSFEESVKKGNLNLADNENFNIMIDIRRCRLEGIRPLPQRVLNNGKWELTDIDGVGHDGCDIGVKERSRYDLSKVGSTDRQLSRFDIWERKLLDFTLRNNMLNLHLSQKAIQLITFDIDKIEDHLQDGAEYLIVEKPNIDVHFDSDERLFRSKLYPTLQDLISRDIEHHSLHTYQPEAETRNTLKNIYRSARNAIEETGANALYLTIGTLRWYETDVIETPRYAPILMLPVEMVYKKGQYYVRTRDEEIMLNVTLFEFLRQNFDIEIPGLDPLPTDEHGVDITLIFAIIRDALKNQKRWDIEEEAILGVFSFSKFLMWNDIHNHRDELMENKVVESLVEQRLTWQPEPLVTALKDKDKATRPEDLALPVPVDSSQMAAVCEAALGHTFILYGPPGTGKSQTITNIIANALFQGKRVLFVAEKMAALSVVQSRLAKIGLDPFCLEMHSNKATKRHILDQLAKALNVHHTASPEEYGHTADNLFAERQKLIAYMEALHETRGNDGFTLYECIVRYEETLPFANRNADGEVQDSAATDADCPVCLVDDADSDTATVELDNILDNITKEDWPAYQHLLGPRLVSVLSIVGQPSEHPLLGMHISEADLALGTRLRSTLAEESAILEQAVNDYDKLAAVSNLRDEILHRNKPAIFEADAERLLDEWGSIKSKWFLPRYFAKRSFVNRLRVYNPLIAETDIDDLLVNLVDYHRLHDQIASVQRVIAGRFADYSADTLPADTLPTEEDMSTMASRLTKWGSHLETARDWFQWCDYRKSLTDAGLHAAALMIERHAVAAADVLPIVTKTIFKALAERKIAQSPALRTFEGAIFDDTVALYKKLTTEFQKLSELELGARLAAAVPRVTDNISSSSEIGLVNRNISNGGRGTSIRDLLDQIPQLIKRLCPCMLMSPMSVAQYLSLQQEKFDLVIFDEASQIPTSEAVGAIARGNALIVVGDPKQMPPTSFFTSSNVNEDEADIDDMESILEDCRTLQIPSLQLNWHYRSQHESLIAFSNNEYYEGSLITFPSADDRQTKVVYVPIDGVYDKGGRRSNKAEAEAIVAEIVRRLQMEDSANHSIGVISFSIVQQYLIEDLLQERLDRDKVLREAADNLYEPIFVKNLENVQGDERDIILFSIGYGPDKEGNVSMNFGPLNNAGGERRLNVAVSRARQEMMVFSSLHASQIDLNRSQAKGVAGLKHFLEFAEQQILVQSEASVAPAEDTLVAQQIADALTQKGYNTSVAVGRSNFKVDIAVATADMPDIYTLGILLDGEGYHNTQTTRDREIVQPTVLGNLNWQVMRVWSVDWFNNPQRVLSRIIERMENAPVPEAKFIAKDFEPTPEENGSAPSRAIPYVECRPTKRELASDALLARKIIEAEQPITLAQLCRRVSTLRGEARATPKVIRDFKEIVDTNYFSYPDRKGFAVWSCKEQFFNYRNYRQANGRDISDIPLAEIKNVVLEALEEQFAIPTDALTLIAAKKLGFSRRGPKVDEALSMSMNQLIEEGTIQLTDGKLSIRTDSAKS